MRTTAEGVLVELEAPWWKGITRYQWIVLVVTAFGLMFDLMDANLLGFAMSPALRQLFGARASTEVVGWYGGLITTIFLIGWSLGGILFGIFSDYYGRKAALIYTILIYSVFTGLAALSHAWWDFAIYRFLTAMGIGGEWAAGTVLLAETWPEHARVKGAILLQSASSTGAVVASVIYFLVGGYGWRYIFVVGAVPGFLLLALRWWVKESDRWTAERATATVATGKKAGADSKFTLGRIFERGVRRDTIVGTALATTVTFGYWGVGWFVPTMINEMMIHGSEKFSKETMVHYVSDSRILIACGSLACFGIFLLLGTQWRRKTVLLMFFLGAFITTMCTLLVPSSLHSLLMWLPVMGFFTLGIWVVFPIYLPELYSTELRGTGSGFCFTFGRAFSALGPVLTGALIAHTGSFVTAMSVPTFAYLLGPIALIFARETQGQGLVDITVPASD